MGREPSWKTEIKIDKENVQSSPVDIEEKTTSLMLGEHLINLAKAITKKKTSEGLQRTKPKQKLK
jgi:hypothetical protein